MCLCSVDEDEDDDEGDEDEELESPGGAENTRSLFASVEPLRKAKSWGSCCRRALVGEPKSTGDEKLTVTDPSGPATKVSGRGDCQTHSLVSVCSLVSSFLLLRAHCETDLSPYAIWLKKTLSAIGFIVCLCCPGGFSTCASWYIARSLSSSSSVDVVRWPSI